MATVELRWQKITIPLFALVLTLSGCVVDEPAIESTQGNTPPTTQPAAQPSPAGVTETVAPQFEPTVPAAPTAAPAPTAVPAPPTVEPTATTVEPTATTVPEPTATPAPAGPTPLPTSAPEAEFVPVPASPGLIVIPVQGVSFMLAETRPILQLGGHTLIYIDAEGNAEVDIFTPLATRDATPFDDYAAVISYIESDPVLAELEELTPVSIAGLPTRVFEGTADSEERVFLTELGLTGDNVLGWFPPARMRLWVIDHPDGAVIVTAESLENPGRYSEAVRLATEVLSTIDFG